MAIIVPNPSSASAVEIKTLYESNPDTNEFNDAEKSKLAILDPTADLDKPVSTAQQEAHDDLEALTIALG